MMKKPLLLLILLSSVSMVLSYPILPESYWGYVKINGTAVPEGNNLTVKVTASNEIVGSTLVGTNGLYTLDIPFDDNDTITIDEGANESDSLTWFIGGMTANSPSPGYDKANSGNHNSNFIIEIIMALKGDVNKDGSLTGADVIKLKRILIGLDSAPGGVDIDVNGDSKITGADFVKLKRILLGLE